MYEIEDNSVMTLLAKYKPEIIRINKNGLLIFYGKQEDLLTIMNLNLKWRSFKYYNYARELIINV